ncbi:hypothetical protein GALMADRAFT_136260 [Galerina marginata CBS 339.88]|uniref:Non-haem dioxygenase N-terminal domain-containing protein n=1 Tax=Galerina marginata (strain CBS 339.88) TaxID=685588 RepID=A0A067TFU2_GALM3|nr:hypothetical protein GALMADRAFT_136260 [Galerina marginata CBS 339.88]
MSDMTPLPPGVSSWRHPEETKCIPDSEYTDLTVVDISNLINDPTSTSTLSRSMINRAFQGFQDAGFIVLTGHGLSPEAISRQFDLGNMYLSVPEEVKHQFHAKISEGSWAGYKPQGYFKRINGARDTTEFHDFYPETLTDDLQPSLSWPYLGEIKNFYYHTHFVLLRTVLSIVSQGLGLDPNWSFLGSASSTRWTSRSYPYEGPIPRYLVPSVIFRVTEMAQDSSIPQIHLARKIATRWRNYGFQYTQIEDH